jgi:hypothetical protein
MIELIKYLLLNCEMVKLLYRRPIKIFLFLNDKFNSLTIYHIKLAIGKRQLAIPEYPDFLAFASTHFHLLFNLFSHFSISISAYVLPGVRV